MKKLQILFILLLFSGLTFAQLSELGQFLKNQPEIKKIELIKGNPFFTETWKIMVRQPLDHSDTTKGFFLQRVFVADKLKENPVVLITEGYGANYASMPRYINELSTILNANQICVEHRYFGESWPDSINWDFLTAENAAGDHHKMVEIFKKYYRGKWVNTGISKGGQTAVYHRTFFPNDVDVTVAYVAPLNFGVEDGRHEPFIENNPGTPEQRKKIEKFQIQVLKSRKDIVPKLEEYSRRKGFTYRISMDEVFDYWVLEFPFALWQYGKSPEEIPGPDADSEKCYNYLMNISEPSYFSVEGMEGIKSFYVQALRELGYYGYNIAPFKKYLSIKSSQNYLSKIFIPGDLKIEYNKNTSQQVKHFIENTDSRIMFIYGQFDPWFASGFEVPKKDNLVKIVKPGGSHSSRIMNLPEEQKQLAVKTLADWLNLPLTAN